MVKVAFDVDISCPPADAFDLWADMRNDARWNPICERCVLASEQETGVGAAFKGTYKGFGDVVETVSHWERPHRIARGGHAGAFAVGNDITFTARDDGTTRMRFAGEVKPRGLAVLMTPLMGVMMRRQARKTVGAFKAALERGVRRA